MWTMADTAAMDVGNLFPRHSKRKHSHVSNATTATELVDLTESPPPTPKIRRLDKVKQASNEPSGQRRKQFKIRPIKPEPGHSRPQVKHEPGAETAAPRHEFNINKTKDERQRSSPTFKQGIQDFSGSVILIESPEPAKQPVIEQKECTVCYDTLDTDAIPLRPHMTAAEDHSVCYACWENHLHAELERKEWNRLSCPDCGETMTVADICHLDRFFSERIEPKIMDKAAKSCLEQDPDWVDCPSGTCRSGALMTEGHIFTCSECQFRYCFSCRVPMHEGEACSEYHERLRREPEKRREEDLSLKEVEKVSKPCPGCTARIQKHQGCDHMTCRRCKHEFCWICLANYGGPDGIHTKGNDAHLDSCKYAPGRLPNYRGPRL
ncbi:hypothetical protein AC579_1866 [Pseudocercospora musae]|uniref:RBR-type E3 ubiquitin transferase n=1 Tax=Pseudocercospora musae TaxID=113226 RepID=A0A139IBE2_9PEZI|nr:hypothetical protein AC579_1866 [Pseudocercospora musae]